MKVREVYALPETTYRLDSESYELFRDFQLWYEQTKADERLLKADPVFMQAFGKLEGTCGRIILVNHILTSPYSNLIPAYTTSKAIDIAKGYLVPAYRYALGDTGGLNDDSLERWIADRIVTLSGNVPTVSLSELKHAAKNRTLNIPRHHVNQAISDAMEPLELCHWVTVINDNRDKKTWAINPGIAVQHEAYRIEIIKAKQRRQDASRAIVLAAGQYTPRRFVKGFDPETME